MSGLLPELTAIVREETDDAPAALICPNPECGSDDLQAVWDVPVVCRISLDPDDDTAILHHYGSQETIGDGASENRYECRVCVTEFKLPDDRPNETTD